MSTNNIEDLRRMETPVTDEGWSSIVNDRRYARKFCRKPGLSPKGRAALVAGVATALVALPILVKTLTHRINETSQANIPATETVVRQTETTAQKTATETVTCTPATKATTQSGTDNTPTGVAVTGRSAAHESSTMASVTAKRQQTADNQSREDWPPLLFPEPDGSRLTYDQLLTTPERSDTTGLHTAQIIHTEHPYPHDQEINPGASETTVSADGQVTVKYEYSSEEPETDAEQFFIPTAFTPNGDGLNDLFLVKANFEPRSFEMTVLNRGGEMMFISRDINIGWDGHLRGKLMPQGVYVCIIKYKDSEGKEHKQQGQVLLIP